MANDSETLTFRIRAIAENLGAFRKTADASEEVNASMAKSIKLSDALVGADKKLTTARNQHADALGKVRVAEIKVNEARANTAAKTSQIAAAEERLLTARRNAARSGSEVQRIEQEFRNIASKAIVNDSEKIGRESGKKFSGGFLKFIQKDAASNFSTTSELIGRSFGSGIGSGLEGALRTQAGPLILGVLLAAVAIAAPAIGAVLAGGIVAAFGAGITTLAIVFAAKAEAVRNKWSAVMSQMGRDSQLLAKPFESVLIRIADIAARTFNRFAPLLKGAFSQAAGPVQNFADTAGRALEGLLPAIRPIADAFNEVLRALGPGLQEGIRQVATGLIAIANSVRQNPTALADMISGLGDLTEELLQILAIMNDADGAFKRLTGGVSLVTVVFKGLVAALDVLFTPLVFLAKYIEGVANVLNALKGGTEASGKSMSDAANKTVLLAQGMQKAGGAATNAGPAIKSAADRAAEAKQRAAEAAAAFEAWINQLFRLQNMAITVADSQIRLKSAIAAASAAAKENGKNISINTEKGRANRAALLDVAKAANAQTEAMIRNKTSLVTVAAESAKSKAAFIKLAIQMGFSKKEAEKMAKSMIAIPNVSREARLTANKRDLDTKLADARRQLKDPNLTKERRAKINADIARLVAQLRKAQAQINALKGKTVLVRYSAAGVTTWTAASTRGGGKRAMGGPIYGPGGPTDDRAGLFALSNNEHVWTAKEVQAAGGHKAVQLLRKAVVSGPPKKPVGLAGGGPAVVNMKKQEVFPSVAAGQKYIDKLFGGVDGGPPGARQHFRGVTLNARTIRMLLNAERMLGAAFHITQGSYSTRVAASGSTHAGGGAMDTNGPRGWNTAVAALRRAGFAAWHRTPAQGPWNHHIHSIALGDSSASASAKAQMASFRRGGNGLGGYKNGTPYVPQDGLAYLHKGERVTPAALNGPAKVTFEFRGDGSPYMEFLVREFRKYIRGSFEGDVQAALGGGRG